MSKFGYLEVIQRVPSTSSKRESTVCLYSDNKYMEVESLWMKKTRLVVVVVALLFYVHGKHLRSCRDGQLI